MRLACSGNVWGAVRLLLFAKTVLCAPSTNARKRRLVVASLISDRLQRWNSDKTATSGLWQEALMDNQVKFPVPLRLTHLMTTLLLVMLLMHYIGHVMVAMAMLLNHWSYLV